MMQTTGRFRPDPDGAGTQKRRIEEFVYDRYGHQRGSRVGFEGATAGELDTTVAWSCIATVDGRQRPLSKTIPASPTSPARTVWFDHAKNGNPLVTEACDNNVPGSPLGSGDTCDGKGGVITSTADLLGRSTVYTDVWGKSTTTSYDSAGRIAQRVTPAGSETFEYTMAGQLFRHLLDGVVLASVAYNTAGEMTTVTYGNSTSIADLDGVGRRFDDRSIKELKFNGPSGLITSNTITARDRNGRVLAETIDGQEYRYSYDSRARLIDTQFGPVGFVTPTHHWQYCFDLAAGSGGASSCTSTDVHPVGANGNRVSAFHNGSKVAGYGYDSADRLASVSTMAPYAGNPIVYDTRGNTTQIAGETLTYDGADRHMSTTAGATTSTYQRDLNDRIVGRTAADGSTRYTYGGGGDTASTVLDGSSNPTQSTIALPGGVMLTTTTGGQTWSYPNIQGSVTAVADGTGTKIGSSYLYDPFGSPLAGVPDNSAGALDYGWLGSYQRPLEHASGIRQQIEMGARGYDQALGRFLEVDPVEGGVANDYGYSNEPRGDTDLDGRVVVGLCGSAEFVLGGGGNVSACFAVDGARRTGLTLGAGVGVGLSIGLGFLAFYSNAESIFDLSGRSNCVTLSLLVVGGSFCRWGKYYLIMLGGVTGAPELRAGFSYQWNWSWVHWIHGFGFEQVNSVLRATVHKACTLLQVIRAAGFSVPYRQTGCG